MSPARLWVILKKELVDHGRDRRSWMLMLLYTSFGPLVFALALTQVTRLSKREEPIDLPVVGAERAPGLMEHLRQHDIRPQEPPPGGADPAEVVRAQQREVVLVVPPGYAAELRGGHPATLQLIMDSSRTSAQAAVRRVEEALRGYSQQVGALRLLARGVDPRVVQALSVERLDQATPQGRAMVLMMVLPMFLLMATFMGGLYIAVDTTAGERERGSLEALCTCPVRPVELVLGKLLAVMAFTALLVLLMGLLLFAVLRAAPLELPGMRLSISVAGLAQMLLMLLPLVLLVSALQLWLCSRSRTTKEAQTNGYLLTLLPALPALWQSLVPGRAPAWAQVLPLLGHNLQIAELLRNEPPRALSVLGLGGSTLLCGAALVVLTWRRFVHRGDLLSQ